MYSRVCILRSLVGRLTSNQADNHTDETHPGTNSADGLQESDIDDFIATADSNIDDFIANAVDADIASDHPHRLGGDHRDEQRHDGSVSGDQCEKAQAESIGEQVSNPVKSADSSVSEDDTSSNTPPDPVASNSPESASVQVEPWLTSSMQTPEELIQTGEQVSTWLDSRNVGTTEDDQERQQLAPHNSDPAADALVEMEMPTDAIPGGKPLEDFASLCEGWPLGLEERRTICYRPSPEVATYYARNRREAPCIVYWMRSTLRVTHGNFALEAALLLAQRLGIPLVTVCLVPCAIVYPTCHAATVDDAYARWSFAEVQQQFSQAGLPFFGFAGKSRARTRGLSSDSEGFPLFQLLDFFSPYIVVADNAFDLQARRDLDQLSQYLHATPSSSPWSLVAIDSISCIPVCSRSEEVRRSLEPGERYLGEDDFGRVYTEYSQQQFQPCSFTAIGNLHQNPAGRERLDRVSLGKLLCKLHLEEVNWRIVESMNKQSSPEMVSFGEMDALQKLDRLLGGFCDRPAIQAELQVSHASRCIAIA